MRGRGKPRPRRAQKQARTTNGSSAPCPVGADDPVRPAVCTRKHGRADANPYHVCRGRCPHRPARGTSVLRCIAANLQMPHGRTEASAPTGRFTGSPMAGAILRLRIAGSMWASTPTDVLHYRRECVQICPCILHGRGKVRPCVTAKRGSISKATTLPLISRLRRQLSLPPLPLRGISP